MKKEKLVNQFIKIFWVFIIGSLIGYVVEMIVGLVQNGHFVSRQGLIFGPFAQVYGLGILVYYFVVPKIKGGYLKIFFVTMVLGGIVEYLCSYFQELLFGTISWDYSNLWFNINGRTSLLHCTYWGIGGVLFMKYVMPLINRIDDIIKNQYFRTITALFAIFMLFNIFVYWFKVYVLNASAPASFLISFLTLQNSHYNFLLGKLLQLRNIDF